MVKNEKVEKYLEFVKECLDKDGINVTVEYDINGQYNKIKLMFKNPDKAYRNVTQSLWGDNECGILYDVSRAVETAVHGGN